MANYNSSYTGAQIDSAVGRANSTDVTAGTVAASKAVVVDSNKDVTGFRNITGTGTATFANFIGTGDIDIGDASGDTVTITASVDSNIVPSADDTYDLGGSSAQWKDLYVDGTAYIDAIDFNGTAITSTGAELNLIDGGTARGTTAVATGDGILINDAGTMRMTNVDTVSTYFASHNVGGGNIVTTGALDSGSITSGFGAIDTGSSTITTTGTVSTGALNINTSPLSFSGASTIDTSGNNLLTLQGATAGVRIDDFLGIDSAPNANYSIYSARSFTQSGSVGSDFYSNPTVQLPANGNWRGIYVNPALTEFSGVSAHPVIAGVYINPFAVTNDATATTEVLAGLYIEGAPSGVTPTSGGPYSIFVDAGDCRFDGNLVIGTAGKGIDFDGNSRTAVLDDYEEGTWTGVLSDGSTDMTMDGSNTTGYYTKVGNLVTVTGHLMASSLNGLTSEAIRITGLPFTVANNNAAYSSVCAGYGAGFDLAAAGQTVGYFGRVNATHLELFVWDATTGISAMLASEWSDDGAIMISFSYRVA